MIQATIPMKYTFIRVKKSRLGRLLFISILFEVIRFHARPVHFTTGGSFEERKLSLESMFPDLYYF
jgi:hypothetical protein